MIESRPSRTAYRVAQRRAAHQLLDLPPVLVDPLAIPILGPEMAAALRADPRRFEGGIGGPRLRAFVAVRARFAEDQLARLRAAGIGQYVVLGAGLDTSAYRLPEAARPLRVWEVDHPATQAWKRERLAAAGIAPPPELSFVPVDFEHDALSAALAAAGFDERAGAMVSWMGVTPYLTRAAIFETLGYLARVTAPGGGVAFDYAVDPRRLSFLARAAYRALERRVERAGEPFRSNFDPGALVGELRGLGFAEVTDVPPERLVELYLAGRSDGLELGPLGHLMWAGGSALAI